MKRHGALLATLLLALVGCDGPSTPLADFRDTSLKLILDDDPVYPLSDSKDGLALSVSFEYDTTKGCRRLPSSTRATLDGQDLFVGLGGEMIVNFDGDRSCMAPFVYQDLKRDILKGQDGRLVITDGETTFTVVVPALLAPHQWIPNEPLSGVHPGQEVSFRWSVPTDVVEYGSAIFNADLMAGENRSIDTALEGGALLVRVRDAVVPGPQVLYISGQTQTPVTLCDGPASCQVSVMSAREYPLTVQ